MTRSFIEIRFGRLVVVKEKRTGPSRADLVKDKRIDPGVPGRNCTWQRKKEYNRVELDLVKEGKTDIGRQRRQWTW